MEEIIGKNLGPFEVISQIGTGGMAKVYKAYQPSMDRYVALKVLSSQYKSRNETLLKRFFQEARVVAKLEHPHILPVHEFGETDGYFYIAMRLVETGTLHDRFHGQPLPLENICQIITQVGDALDYAHSEGVVHRDIKLKNILMDQRDNCLLTDFGIAKDLIDGAHITQMGKTLGTPTYMSPEQIRGDELDGRSDIYALGVILYQLATGQPPYDADIPNDIMLQHLQDPLPSPRNHNPDIPAALEKVIIKSLAKGRDKRYATANEMAQAVEAALVDIAITLDEEEDTTQQIHPLEIESLTSEEEDSEATEVLLDEETLETSPNRRSWGNQAFIVIGALVGLLLIVAGLSPVISGLLGGAPPLTAGAPPGPPSPPPIAIIGVIIGLIFLGGIIYLIVAQRQERPRN